MSDDLLKRPLDEVFDTQREVERNPCGAWQAIQSQADRIEKLEAKLAKAVEALKSWLELASYCTIEEGVCCCGDDMKNHADPMDCGHLPVDHGAYIAHHIKKSTRATLAELGERE
jgi:hypothetical protein